METHHAARSYKTKKMEQFRARLWFSQQKRADSEEIKRAVEDSQLPLRTAAYGKRGTEKPLVCGLEGGQALVRAGEHLVWAGKRR
jgi:hypothetical protein